MIHYIDKPGYYRTFSDSRPTYLTETDVQRARCVPLVYTLVTRLGKDQVRKLLARHAAKNLKEVDDGDIPTFLAELEAVSLALGLSDE